MAARASPGLDTLPSSPGRLLQAACTADSSQGWQLLPQCHVPDQERGLAAGSANLRTVEVHEYVPGAQLFSSLHNDHGSLITMDVMLSGPGSFGGGEFTTMLPTLQTHPLEAGDALIFVSHKYHGVQPVLQGRRRVLVLELWDSWRCRKKTRCASAGAGAPWADHRYMDKLGALAQRLQDTVRGDGWSGGGRTHQRDLPVPTDHQARLPHPALPCPA